MRIKVVFQNFYLFKIAEVLSHNLLMPFVFDLPILYTQHVGEELVKITQSPLTIKF